ncbi:ATP12 family chaperone protein [Rhodosalinus sp. 5P4]|uniref:ATP12 family chaperone protein n=1 Tax=Rhodosalinus sp. 5P4 TaxID=3239196 RepID=UPI003526376B
MTGWAAKRFWTRAEAVATDAGYEVTLDGRPVRTPAKAPLVLPNAALAEAMAEEWEAQSDVINPRAMPVTRAANSAIDRVVPHRAEVVAMLCEYGATDLLCYRADTPEELARRQAEGWDPMLDWARARLGAPLSAATGVMHVAQPEASLAALRGEVKRHDAFELVALHDLVTISGSLVLGLAASAREVTPERVWALSRIDETWQQERWGEDAEAAAAADARRAQLLEAHRFLELARAG